MMTVAVVFILPQPQLYVPLSSGWLFLMKSSKMEPVYVMWYFSPSLKTFPPFFHCTEASTLEISQRSVTPLPSWTWIFFSSWRNVIGRSSEDHRKWNIKMRWKQLLMEEHYVLLLSNRCDSLKYVYVLFTVNNDQSFCCLFSTCAAVISSVSEPEVCDPQLHLQVLLPHLVFVSIF